MRVRFAPSPTGYIHIGNARTALFNWLYSRQNGGKFVLRYDDTDQERSRQEYADAILTDLRWLGIEPEIVEAQSSRKEKHDAATQKLKDAGLLYPCYETAEELERRRKLRLARRMPPVYGREALKQSQDERDRFEAGGRKPHWRFLLPNFKQDPHQTQRTEVHWDDIIRGPQTVDLASMSDPVLIREDGSYLYTLPSVVDDIDFGITHVIRGDDHVTNTGVQITIFSALGSDAPTFGHHNLLTTTTGEGLSKRSGALSIGNLREDGYEPMAVNALATLIGTATSVEAVPDMTVLSAKFDPSLTSKSAAKFDPSELDHLNRELVHQLAFEDVQERLSALGIVGDKASAFWNAVRANCDRVSDAQNWWELIIERKGQTEFSDDDRQFVKDAFVQLPPEPWDESTYKGWISAVKTQSGRKGKLLFLPLRKAITGSEAGPELANLLPLLGREEILSRQP